MDCLPPSTRGKIQQSLQILWRVLIRGGTFWQENLRQIKRILFQVLIWYSHATPSWPIRCQGLAPCICFQGNKAGGLLRVSEVEWFIILKNPISLSLFLSLFNLHSWSGLIISLIKGDEFFITPSLSLLVSIATISRPLMVQSTWQAQITHSSLLHLSSLISAILCSFH